MSHKSYTLPQRTFALLLGIACHLAFAAAVLSMMIKLYTGLRGGPTFPLPLALLWDVILILQFPLLHSLLLTDTGGRWLSKMVPGGIGNEMRTTTFALIASLQILLCFLAWAPLGPVWSELHGNVRIMGTGVYVFGWVLLMKSMADAGLGVQMGYLGWWAVWRNRPLAYKTWKAKGTLRRSRHPMYLAYTLLLWSGPVWTPDHALLAGIWTLYCIAAPMHKESRYAKRYGQAFRDYQKHVPYFLPRLSFLRKNKP